ncbi:MAG: class I SAM-dependent methyltransferase [Leptolyngbya sp.]|nr:class I SAM-dependent methyltransferase [Candidatus Melainabacteria bacterium]
MSPEFNPAKPLQTSTESPAQSFKEFEHEGWQSVADGYHDHFRALTMQTIEPMLKAVDAGVGTNLLDIATGPGYVADAAKRQGADVTAVDFSAEMIERAKKLYTGIDFQVGDAEALAFADQTFDIITMNFGLLHLENPEKALKEAFRVLKPGGVFALTVWSTPDKAVAFDKILAAVKAHGDATVKIPVGPPFFRFSDFEEMKKSLMAAGFKTVQIDEIEMVWQLPHEDDLFKAFFTGTPRTGGLLRAQEEEKLASIKDAIAACAREYSDGGTIRIPMSSVLATAR